MSEHRINLAWRRTTPNFDLKSYNREHEVKFKNDEQVNMSAAVAYRGSPNAVDPEEMLVASLSSCHMLTFLAVASRRNFVIDAYEDDAVGHLEKNSDGKLAITRVELRPRIAFAAGKGPNAATLDAMHHEAHEQCFIANSVTTVVTVQSPEPQHA